MNLPLTDFDAAHATEAEINRVYKERWRIVADESYEGDLHKIPFDVRMRLSEQGRQDWIAYTNGAAEMARRAASVEARRARLAAMGVDDKAPPLPQRDSAAPARAADLAPPLPPMRRGIAAPAVANEPRRNDAKPEPVPMDFGTADDVNRAVGGLFGHRLEEM